MKTEVINKVTYAYEYAGSTQQSLARAVNRNNYKRAVTDHKFMHLPVKEAVIAFYKASHNGPVPPTLRNWVERNKLLLEAWRQELRRPWRKGSKIDGDFVTTIAQAKTLLNSQPLIKKDKPDKAAPVITNKGENKTHTRLDQIEGHMGRDLARKTDKLLGTEADLLQILDEGFEITLSREVVYSQAFVDELNNRLLGKKVAVIQNSRHCDCIYEGANRDTRTISAIYFRETTLYLDEGNISIGPANSILPPNVGFHVSPSAKGDVINSRNGVCRINREVTHKGPVDGRYYRITSGEETIYEIAEVVHSSPTESGCISYKIMEPDSRIPNYLEDDRYEPYGLTFVEVSPPEEPQAIIGEEIKFVRGFGNQQNEENFDRLVNKAWYQIDQPSEGIHFQGAFEKAKSHKNPGSVPLLCFSDEHIGVIKGGVTVRVIPAPKPSPAVDNRRWSTL